ncbi:hypothetical protein RSAG8_07654, partial [Rhizoctonia solani AG-8 WAC10335]
MVATTVGCPAIIIPAARRTASSGKSTSPVAVLQADKNANALCPRGCLVMVLRSSVPVWR